MRPASLGVALSALVLAAGAQAGPLDEARALHAVYHEDLTRLDRARDLLEEMLRQDPQIPAFVLLARIYLTWGDVRARDPESKLGAYERGRDVAKRAVELAPRDSEAHFWYAANLGRWGQTKGIFRSLLLLPTLKHEMEILLDLTPKHPAAHGFAGNFYLEVPALLGGDLDKAETHLREAIRLDPQLTVVRLELAKLLIKRGRYAEARRELQRVLDETEPRWRADWAAKDRPRAQTLLDSIRGKG